MLYQNNIQPIGAGIYENIDLGLLSLSSDGTSWITLKNTNLRFGLGGRFFQWGNNYGFDTDPTTSSIQVDATNYGPYYESDTFIARGEWTLVNNPNMRGSVTNTNDARKGPCQEGFHIPSGIEGQNIVAYMNDFFGINNPDPYLTYLKMPKAGDIVSGNKRAGKGSYWCSTPGMMGPSMGAYIFIDDTHGSYGEYSRGAGFSIRPFKNTPEIPDSTRTQLYDYGGQGGIYYNQSVGLISIGGTSLEYGWITISDKNLGATEVYNSGDNLSQANCGNFYQRGNNYGFSYDGPWTTSTTQVNATNYGPYYNSGTFITNSSDWTSVTNDNLRGGETNTNKAMKGPCEEGFHVPTDTEFEVLKLIMGSFGKTLSADYLQYLHMYPTDFLDGETGQRIALGTQKSHLWTASGKTFITYSDREPTIGGAKRTDGRCIRPFKNGYVTPNSNRIKLL